MKQNEASHLISPRSSRACGELASIGYQAAGHDKFDTAGSHVSRALGPLQQEGANELQLMVDFLEGRRPNVEFLSGGEEQHFTLTRSAARPRSRVGIAVDRGLIPSVEEPVTRYVPELAAHGFEAVTLRHLLQMTSGLRFDEHPINPLGQAASFCYGISLRQQIAKLRLEHPPGTHFHYASGSTQLLSIALERALNGPTLTEFLQEMYRHRYR